MNRQQIYSFDTAIETAMAKFMDEYFYSLLVERKNMTFSRIADKKLLTRGVDVILNKAKIDEKAKVWGCMNNILLYPSFELSILNKANYYQDGWFLNTDNITDYYLLLSYFGTAQKEFDISFSNILKINALLVSKKELKDWILNYTSLSDIRKNVQLLRDDPDGYTHYEKPLFRYAHKMFHLTYSISKPEQPINLVIKREHLKQLSKTKEFEITSTSIRQIKD